ncbi:N-acetyltransferase 9, partial [Perkinsus chesapeaki]
MVRTAADGDGTSSVSSSEPRDSVASNRFTRSTLSRLEKERSRLILELDEYRESNVALRSDLEQCVDRLNACEDELVFQHNELERSTKEGFHLKKKVEKMEGLLKREFGDDAATQYSALLDENERLQDELDDMAEEREQLEAENTGGDIDDMTKQLEQLTEENKDLTSEVDDLKEESDRLRRKLAVLRTEHEVAVAKLSAIDQATQPVVQEGVQTDETWLPTIKEEGQEDTNTEGSTTTPPEAADNSSTRGRSLSQDTQLNTLRMAYDLLQEENEETKHQLAILTDASEDSGGAAAKLVDLQKQFDEYRKEHPDTPSTNATCSGEATPEKEQSRSNSSSTANSAIVPPPLVREDSNDVDPLEKNVDDLEGALREKDGKIAELQEYIADLERMQKEGVILDCKGNEVIPTTTPEGDKDDDDITKRAARLAAEIESYQEQLRAKDEQINELKKLAEPVITKRRSSARSDGSKSQGSRSRGPSGGSNDATTAYDLDGNDVDSLKSRCKKLEEEKKLSDSQLEYVQSEYEKLRKEKEKQVMELEHTIVDTKLKLAQVDTYNSWMANSEELRTETESELLTLKEEYEMQASWREDPDKLTFIVLDREVEPDPNLGHIADGGGMCGDVNCFVSEITDDDAYPDRTIKEGEISVMTAVPSSRHKGIAREAVTMMETYCRDKLHID